MDRLTERTAVGILVKENYEKYETYLRIYSAVERAGHDGKVGGVDGN